ncbi:MAG: hypothetical protein N3G21_06750, partial [Candidatus Hydrogenedentes bacterium]|nr:hypothetical protein [Candidatus Hydrogenedentota bacterium]
MSNHIGLRIFIYLGLLIVGIFLRLSRISTESISLEEYACIANLNVDGVINFISVQRNTYPYGGILFPVLQFLWAQIAGSNIVSLRIFSLLFWVATYILIVIFAHHEENRSRLPKGVSIIISVGLSFSPALIFLGQEARMYMGYIFFSWCAIISLYYFLIKHGSVGWGIVWTVSNICSLWIHHTGIVVWCIGALVVGLMGIFIPSIRRRLFYFAIVHFVVACIWVVWLITIPPQPPQLHQYYLTPTIRNLLEFPFAFNVVRFGGICPADPYLSFYYLPKSLGDFLRFSNKSFNFALIGISYLSIIGLVIGIFQVKVKESKSLLYLLSAFLLLPPLILFLIARVGPPAFTSRYLVFILPIHFFGLGIIAGSAKRFLRFGFIFLVILLLTYQIGYMFSGHWRMDWKGVGETIFKQASSKDLVIIRDPFWSKIFEINCPELALPVSDMYTYEGILEVATVYLSASLREDMLSSAVWVVVPDVYGEGEPVLLSHKDSQKFSISARMFPGEQRIWLYKILLNSIPPREEYSLLLPRLNLIVGRIFELSPEELEEFYRLHRYDHDRTQFHFIRTALVVAEKNKYFTAGELIMSAWDRNPNRILEDYKFFSDMGYYLETNGEDATAYLWEGVKCFLENDFETARSIFLDLSVVFPNDPLTYWLLARVYEKLNDVSKADWFWRKVFICSPILPLGWHLLY